MLKKFITELKVSFEQLFTDDVRNDQNIMGFFKISLHKWKFFKALRDQYEGSQTRDNRKSGLKRKLGEIDEAIIKIKKLFSEICDISNQIRGLVGSTFQLSQSYLKKSETLMNSLTSLGALKDKITDPELLNALRRRIKQQNEIVDKFFIRNSDEMLNFFCENNTQLTWADVEDNLILYINSRTEVPSIETDELIRASDIIKQNIVTYERELEFSMTPEKVRKVVKTMPVMYLKSQIKSLFINLHEFVLTPGVFESILLLEKPADSVGEAAGTVVDIDSVVDNDCRIKE